MRQKRNYVKGRAFGYVASKSNGPWSHYIGKKYSDFFWLLVLLIKVETDLQMPKSLGRRLTIEERKSIGNIPAESGQNDLPSVCITQVAMRFGIADGTARKWLLEGLKAKPNYDDAARSGRRPKVTQRQKNNMRRHAKHRKSARRIRGLLEVRQHIKVSRSTVKSVLGSGRNTLNWG